ncbi:polysaccharide biosynthesis protein [Lachnospiraceae bacterium ZAX-1]
MSQKSKVIFGECNERSNFVNNKQFYRHPFIAGTLFLTLAGLLSRLIGFFYRIFLSQTVGAEGIGIYQLIFPIYALAFSFTAAGIQTAISKFVAEATAGTDASKDSTEAMKTNTFTQPHNSTKAGTFKQLHSSTKNNAFKQVHNATKSNAFKQPNLYLARTYLYAGLTLSLSLSFLCTFFLYHYADFIAVKFLGEPRCIPLLKILSITIPFGAIHACINGYYYGLQKTAVPALSQLIEQIARVGSIYLIYRISAEQGKGVSVNMAVWGIVIGEFVSVLFCINSVASTYSFKVRNRCKNQLHCIRRILTLSLPLSANRILLNLLQSSEAIMIPGKLREFGYSHSTALSVYGVLTGMALPMILFPSAVTNSVSVMLLPAVSWAQAKGDRSYIQNTVKKTFFYCTILGLSCTFFFLLAGKWIGIVVFANELAGTLIMILGWICPFLYLTTTLSSILNGLGKTSITFMMNMIGSMIRIFFVVFIIPAFGIKAYLWGTLVSHLVMALWALAVLYLIAFKKQ